MRLQRNQASALEPSSRPIVKRRTHNGSLILLQASNRRLVEPMDVSLESGESELLSLIGLVDVGDGSPVVLVLVLVHVNGFETFSEDSGGSLSEREGKENDASGEREVSFERGEVEGKGDELTSMLKS